MNLIKLIITTAGVYAGYKLIFDRKPSEQTQHAPGKTSPAAHAPMGAEVVYDRPAPLPSDNVPSGPKEENTPAAKPSATLNGYVC